MLRRAEARRNACHEVSTPTAVASTTARPRTICCMPTIVILGTGRRCARTWKMTRTSDGDGTGEESGIERDRRRGDGQSRGLPCRELPAGGRPTVQSSDLQACERDRRERPRAEHQPQSTREDSVTAVSEHHHRDDRADADGSREFRDEASPSRPHVEVQLRRRTAVPRHANGTQNGPLAVDAAMTTRAPTRMSSIAATRSATTVRRSRRWRHRSSTASFNGVRHTNASSAAPPSATPATLGATSRPSSTGSKVRPQPPCSAGSATARRVDRECVPPADVPWVVLGVAMLRASPRLSGPGSRLVSHCSTAAARTRRGSRDPGRARCPRPPCRCGRSRGRRGGSRPAPRS